MRSGLLWRMTSVRTNGRWGWGVLKTGPPLFSGRNFVGTDTIGSFGQFSLADDPEYKAECRRRLIAEDAALRPWLIGKALQKFEYTLWERIKFVIKESLDAAIWSWRLSK